MKDFNQLPHHSKVWIYQAERELSDQDLDLLKSRSAEFLNQWTSHDYPMDAAIGTFHKRFIVVSVDEQTAPASGCGIDKSVRFIQQMEKELNNPLLNRMNIAYLSGSEVLACSFRGFERLYQNKEVNRDTLVFNNMVTAKKDFDTQWIVPLKDTWIFGRMPATLDPN
jgi:hypothetical protein